MRKINWGILVIFLFSQSMFAQSIVADNIATGSPLYYNHSPNIAQTSDGALGVVWNSADGQVVYSEYDESFQVWSPAVAISNAGDVAEKAGIVADDNGNLFVAWQQRETSDQDYAIYFTKKSGGIWSTPVNLSGNDAENEECGIEVSDNGTVFVAWNTDAESDGAEFVYCVSSSDQGASWSTPVVLSSEDGIIGGSSTTSGRPTLAKGKNGKMVCTWHEEPDGHPDREPFVNQYDGTNWLGEAAVICTSDSGTTFQPTIGVDSQDNIYLIAESTTGDDRALLFTKSWEGQWDSENYTTLVTDPEFEKPILAVDKNDNMYLAFRRDIAADTLNGTEEIAYITSNNKWDTWTEPVVLSRESYDAGYVSIASNVRDNGVDILWRESARQFVDDGDSTAVLYSRMNLIEKEPSPRIDNQSIVADNIPTGSPLYYNHSPNVAQTGDGVVGVVWNSADGQVVYSEYDESFQVWSPAVAISNAGDVAEKAGIVADDNGNLFVVWQQRDASDQNYAIYFTKKTGGLWSTPVNLSGNDAENEECGIEVSDNGTVFVAWNTDAESDGAEFVYCVSSSDQGASWSTPVVLSSEDGIIGGSSTTSGRPTLAKGKNGKMVCTWHEEPDGHPDREPFVNQYDGTNWLGETAVICTSDSGTTFQPTIGVDSQDNIYLIAESTTGDDRALLFSKSWEGQWDSESYKELAIDSGLEKPILAVDKNDNMYLAFRRSMEGDDTGLEEIAYITSNDKWATRTEPVVLSRESYDAGYVSIASNVRDNGVDILWRESARQFVDDGDSTAVLYAHMDLLTSVDDFNPTTIAKEYQLSQNYPNPFNPSTVITFSIPQTDLVSLKVFNLLGQEVAELVNEVKSAGTSRVTFNSKNLSTGVYIYQLKSGDFTSTKKMMFIK